MVAALHSWWTHAPRALFEPIDHLLDPTRRLFVPFLLSAAAIAWLVAVLRGVSASAAARALVDRRLWLHRSALADYQLVALKALVRALFAGLSGVSALVVAGSTVAVLRSLAPSPALRAPLALVAALFTLTAFIVEDLSRFALHALMHRVPLLWAFHRVHHSAEVLTPVTLYRTHPVESALNRLASALVIGAVTGVFVWLFGGAVRGWQLFSVDALGFLWTLCGANLRHSHVWLSYGHKVERWLLSPAQHQIHHSAAPEHREKNLGTALALWDRLFGTLYTTSSTPERLRFGLSDEGARQSGPALLIEPFAWLARRARGRSRALAAPTIATACTTAIIAGCVPTPRGLDRAAMLDAIRACTADAHTQFQTSVDALAAATASWSSQRTTARREAARAAWNAAFDRWQEIEMLRFGPTAERTEPGGQALRAQVYAWPEVNRCRIEEQLASRGYASPSFADAPVSVRGLGALEFLLFSTETTNVCPPEFAINAMGTWAALSADELDQRRAEYAQILAAQLVTTARAIQEAWTRSGGFAQQLTTAGRGSALFETQQAALSAVIDGPALLDTDTKDRRLGTPLGLFGCPNESCPEAIEAPYADRGAQSVRNNVRGARRILLGCAAGADLGFDDMLEGAGATMLAARLRARVAEAERAADAIASDGLARPLAQDPASLRAAHAAIRELTSFMKMELVTTLELESRRVAGDTD